MEKLFKLLNISNLNTVEIFVDDDEKNNGYGLKIDNYIITVSHVINDFENIIIESNNYKVLLNIDEYDICILIKNNDLYSNLNDFVIKLSNFINKKNSIIDYQNDYQKYCNIKDTQIRLTFNKLDELHIKTCLMPSIPVYFYENNDVTIDLAGYSGSIIMIKNRCHSILVCEKQSTKQIIGLPLEIIFQILNTFVLNNMKFYHIPIVLKNNCVIQNFRNLIQNDIITKINNIDLIDNKLYFDKLNIYVNYDTYILLNNINSIAIEYYRKNKKGKKNIKSSIKLIEINYKNFNLNFKINTSKTNVLKNILFSELSEEYLIECICKEKKIPDINYDNMYSKKKLIFLKDTIDLNILEIFKKQNVNIENNTYIVKKISGINIKNIDEFKKYNEYKTLTIDLIDSNNRDIKIKI